jgi:hypothetical protein
VHPRRVISAHRRGAIIVTQQFPLALIMARSNHSAAAITAKEFLPPFVGMQLDPR